MTDFPQKRNTHRDDFQIPHSLGGDITSGKDPVRFPPFQEDKTPFHFFGNPESFPPIRPDFAGTLIFE
jgi:hypothetical protein